MKLKTLFLSAIAFSLLFLACEKSEEDKDTVFSKDGRKVEFSPNDVRGNFKDIGEVGIDGIDMSGYISNIYGGLDGRALITCDRAGTYGYQVVKHPYGACELNEAEFTTYWETGALISHLSGAEVYYDQVTEAGTHRIIYFSQGSRTDYNYEIRVRFIEE